MAYVAQIQFLLHFEDAISFLNSALKFDNQASMFLPYFNRLYFTVRYINTVISSYAFQAELQNVEIPSRKGLRHS